MLIMSLFYFVPCCRRISHSVYFFFEHTRYIDSPCLIPLNSKALFHRSFGPTYRRVFLFAHGHGFGILDHVSLDYSLDRWLLDHPGIRSLPFLPQLLHRSQRNCLSPNRFSTKMHPAIYFLLNNSSR